MYHQENTVSITLDIARGALAIYLDGVRSQNLRKMLFGLGLLRTTSPDLLNEVILTSPSRGLLTPEEIRRLIEADDPADSYRDLATYSR